MPNLDPLLSLDNHRRARILVFGDLVLDRYVWGNVERVSQEAPVLLLRSERTENSPGGAAAVCHTLRALQTEACCAGIVGADAAGTTLRRMLDTVDVDCQALVADADCRTAVTERFVGRTAGRHWHQILQVEHEVPQVLTANADSALTKQFSERIGDCQAALIYDSGRRTCTAQRVAALIRAAAERDIRVFAAPCSAAELSHYRGASVLIVDRQVVDSATSATSLNKDELVTAGRELCRRYELEATVITLEPHRLALVHASGQVDMFSAPPRQVFDFTEVRPAVLATFGSAAAGGADLTSAGELANVAASLAGEHLGGTVVSRIELESELLRCRGRATASKVVGASEVVHMAEAARAAGRKIVFTNGCFDILHEGHVTYLEQAAAQGDLLIIGLNSDSSVQALKGPTRPVRKESARAGVLAGLASVDYVVVFDDPTPKTLIEAVRPDVLVKGGDWRGREHEIAGREFVESYGGRLYLAPVVEGVSTTQIVRSIAA